MKNLIKRIFKKEDPQKRELNLIIRIADTIRLNEVDTLEILDITAGFLLGEAYSDMKRGSISIQGYKILQKIIEIIYANRRKILENE